MNEIPPMTDPLGRYWDQPDPSGILLDDTHAVMTAHSFKALHDYSHSMPTGVYPGKMWKRQTGKGTWYLTWFGEHEDPKLCSINQRILLVV
jgi:hypothetical protein